MTRSKCLDDNLQRQLRNPGLKTSQWGTNEERLKMDRDVGSVDGFSSGAVVHKILELHLTGHARDTDGYTNTRLVLDGPRPPQFTLLEFSDLREWGVCGGC
jgi:hypothetical protein